MKIKIHVSKEHIDTAKRADATACMVHDAIVQQLQLPNTVHVHTGYDKSDIAGPSGSLTIKHSPSVATKIRNWDQDEDPDPFDFNATLPDDWRERLGL